MGIDDQPDDQPDDDPRWRVTPTKIVVTIILLAAIVLPLLTGTYSRTDPRLFGFPFFYWYQFLWVFLAAGCCYLSYLLLRREARAYQARQHTASAPPTAPPPDAGGPADGPRRSTGSNTERGAE